MKRSFHSISFPSEWGREALEYIKANTNSFHSISFPSEWGRRVLDEWPSED